MDRPPLIVLEVVLGGLVPLGWAVWELMSLRRDRKRQEREARGMEGADGAAPEPDVAREDRRA
ncbi:MAG: hypothetical protein K8R60_00215 [Burkholderiales bacterium]|nr:hypothetical protein [Burkholderiales bacterium]